MRCGHADQAGAPLAFIAILAVQIFFLAFSAVWRTVPVLSNPFFEARNNRLALVGLFLALLELIREKLVWVEQQASSSIYLRALTDEPAEQAVQKAIIAAEADNDNLPQAVQQKPPPLTISEFASKVSSIVSPLKQEQEEIQSVQDQKPQETN